jgi:hypothetical protein
MLTVESGADPTVGEALTVLVGAHTLFERYAWRWLADPLVTTAATRSDARWTMQLTAAEGALPLVVARELVLDARGFSDRVTLHNPGDWRVGLSLELDALTPATQPRWSVVVGAFKLAFMHLEGTEAALQVDGLAAVRPDGADWELSLAAGETVTLEVQLQLQTPAV